MSLQLMSLQLMSLQLMSLQLMSLQLMKEKDLLHWLQVSMLRTFFLHHWCLEQWAWLIVPCKSFQPRLIFASLTKNRIILRVVTRSRRYSQMLDVDENSARRQTVTGGRVSKKKKFDNISGRAKEVDPLLRGRDGHHLLRGHVRVWPGANIIKLFTAVSYEFL